MNKKAEKYYQTFYNWLENQKKNGYQPIMNKNELEKLIQKVVKLYETKYPDDYLLSIKEIPEEDTFNSLEQLATLLQLSESEFIFLKCPYKGSNFYYDEESKKTIFAIYLPKKDNPIERAIIYFDELWHVNFSNIHGLDDILELDKIRTIKGNETSLWYIYLQLKEKQPNNIDLEELETKIKQHGFNYALRKRTLILAILSLKFSKNTSYQKLGNIRAEKLMNDFSHYPNLYLVDENLLKIEKIYQPKLKLPTLYNNYLIEFKQTGKHPHPAELLALLLISEKDNFLPLEVTTGELYQFYKEEIDAKIAQVTQDFQITKEEIIEYIEKTVISYEKNYEQDKIWHVFCEGFGAMHHGIWYRPYNSQAKMYSDWHGYWDKPKIKHESRKKKKARKKREAKKLGTKY